MESKELIQGTINGLMIARNLLSETLKQHRLYPDTGETPQPSSQQWAFAIGGYMGDLSRSIDGQFARLQIDAKLTSLDDRLEALKSEFEGDS